MKIKTDFITNSSSSAFVIIGVRLDNIDDYEDMWSLANETGWRFFGEENVFGKEIAKLDLVNDFEPSDMDFSQIELVFNEVREKLKELGIGGEVKLIADVFST